MTKKDSIADSVADPIATFPMAFHQRVNRWLALASAAICVTLFALSLILGGCGGDEEGGHGSTEEATETHAEAQDDYGEHGDDGGHGSSTGEPSHGLSEDDSLMALLEGEDESVIENIMANLEILDYEPSDADIYGVEPGMSKEDSVEATKWLEEEEARLDAREQALNKREKELNALDKSVSQKVLRIEQAESARIAQLARLYDGMDPRAVAKLAANLDDQTVVSILPRMKPKNASLVLQMMPAKRAALLSKKMITIAEN